MVDFENLTCKHYYVVQHIVILILINTLFLNMILEMLTSISEQKNKDML